MIAVTGASGKLGSAVVKNLLKKTEPSKIIACVRKPEHAGSLKARGVDVRRGDYDDPESLDRSFAGAERLLLISSSGIDQRNEVPGTATQSRRQSGPG